LFDILLRGFAPLIPSRPWVVEEIMSAVELKKENPVCLAFSTGRSGFFHALEKKYPQAEYIAIEPSLFPFLVSWAQTLVRYTKIKVYHKKIHHVKVKQADFIYVHLYPDAMRGLGRRLKFECRPDTVIISAGFSLQDLEPKEVISLEDRRGKLDWLSKNQKLFQRKSKKFKKENKAYVYVI
jgi:hypothetical protein